MSTDALAPAEAQALATQTLAAITEASGGEWDGVDRWRVESDLDGLLQHAPNDPVAVLCCAAPCPYIYARCPDARRYSEGLRRTAALKAYLTDAPHLGEK